MVRKTWPARRLYLFFPFIIFLGPNWCSYFDTSTNYGTYIRSEKITTKKKGTVVWPAMLFGGFKLQPEKLRPEKKRYSHLADGWNLCFLVGSNYNWKKLRPPPKKATVVWPMVEINLRYRLSCQNTNTNYYKTGKKYDQKKRYSRLVAGWSTKHKTQHTQTQQPTRWAMLPYVFNSTILFGGVNWWHSRTPIRCLPWKRIIVFQNCLN